MKELRQNGGKPMKSAKNAEAIKEETTFGEEVIHSLNDFFDAVDRGETITVRSLRLELEPGVYTANDVRKTRNKLAVSQAVFAKLLAVKVKTVQAWEQGDHPPTGTARRLLDEINQDPQRWLKMLKAWLRKKVA
jgi:putative transcriptional regulator